MKNKQIRAIRVNHPDWMLIHHLEKPVSEAQVRALWNRLRRMVNGRPIDWRFRDGFASGLLGRHTYEKEKLEAVEGGVIGTGKYYSVTKVDREAIEDAWKYAFSKCGYNGETILVELWPREVTRVCELKKCTKKELYEK